MKGKGPIDMLVWEAEMNSLTTLITKAIDGSVLSKEAAVLAGAIVVVGQCRIYGLNEDLIWKEARKACPDVVLPRA